MGIIQRLIEAVDFCGKPGEKYRSVTAAYREDPSILVIEAADFLSNKGCKVRLFVQSIVDKNKKQLTLKEFIDQFNEAFDFLNEDDNEFTPSASIVVGVSNKIKFNWYNGTEGNNIEITFSKIEVI